MDDPRENAPVDKVPFTTDHLLAHLQIEADFVVERAVVTRGQRIVIRDLLLQAHAEIRRLKEHSVILNRVAWQLHEAIGRIPDGATEYFGDIEEDLPWICSTLRDAASLRLSYDALVSNSSAEHQRMSDLLQALSTNITRLDEEKEQDRHTIEYWKGQYEHASERIHDLECHALEIVEYARDQDARLKDLETAVSTPQPSAALTRLRTMFGLDSALDAEQVFVAVERYDAANLQTIDSLRDHVAMHAKLGQLAHKQAERWQEMAEDLWEELQTRRPRRELWARILAAKWDEITNAADWADDEPVDNGHE